MTPDEYAEIVRESVDIQKENQRVTEAIDARLTRERDENIRLSFAQAALTGLVSRGRGDHRWFAETAFAIADAMIARSKR